MKKILITLWTIIIVGIIFIGYSMLAPKSADTPSPGSKISRNGKNTEIPNLEAKKNYGEYLALGDKYFKEENYAFAVENYQAADEISENYDILEKLAESLLRNNQFQKSKETFQKAETIKPDSTTTKLGEIRSMIGLKDLDNAKIILWTLDPTNPDVKYYRSIFLVLYKQFDDAKTSFSDLIAQQEPLPDQTLKDNSQKFLDKYALFGTYKESSDLFLQTMLAKALTEVNQNAAAVPLLYDVLQQQNNYRDAWLVLGYAYLKVGQSADAVDALLRAKDLDPEKPETLFFLGLAYFANDDEEKAIQYLKQAEEKGYKEEDVISLKLGELYTLQSKFRTAEKYYEKVIALNPNSINTFIKAIWLNVEKLGDPSKAVELADQAIGLFPKDPMSYNLKGWALTAQGEYEDARTFLTKALDMSKDFDAAMLNLGWLYEKQDLNVLAKEYYKKAYTLGKGNSISALAAQRFNRLTALENNQYYKADVLSQ